MFRSLHLLAQEDLFSLYPGILEMLPMLFDGSLSVLSFRSHSVENQT